MTCYNLALLVHLSLYRVSLQVQTKNSRLHICCKTKTYCYRYYEHPYICGFTKVIYNLYYDFGFFSTKIATWREQELHYSVNQNFVSYSGHDSSRGKTIHGYQQSFFLILPAFNGYRVSWALNFLKTKNLRIICSLQTAICRIRSCQFFWANLSSNIALNMLTWMK